MLAQVVRLYCYGPRSPINSSYFDLATKTWSVAEGAVQRSFGPFNSATTLFDPSRNRIWYRGDGTQSRVGFVDLATRNHSYAIVPDFNGSGYATSCRDPKRDLWLSIGKLDDTGRVGFAAVDLNNPSAGYKKIALTGDSLPLWDAGLDWCPTLDCAFAYFSSDPQAVYRFTPAPLD